MDDDLRDLFLGAALGDEDALEVFDETDPETADIARGLSEPLHGDGDETLGSLLGRLFRRGRSIPARVEVSSR